ncbi:hypothetical protein FBUS_03884 [Fasciolopsis buskii]|uniref:Uncharacterized protein n=1 Tax=Fasciolopsis buskii TaxID=27845 RepID=A0A8E0VMF7_9TREM|nr:hypothetical protein FBUS_03884 [Fasciolopsis buski]
MINPTIEKFEDAIGSCSDEILTLGGNRRDCVRCVNDLFSECLKFCVSSAFACRNACVSARTYGKFSCKANLE